MDKRRAWVFALGVGLSAALHDPSAYAATESVVYAFKGGTDGAAPTSNLLNVKGTLYGTTQYGGGATQACPAVGDRPNGCGAVFAVSTTGVERVVHAFQGGTADVSFPSAGLIVARGALYGTAGSGFSVTTKGDEKVYPWSGSWGLLNVKGTLYGVMEYGGTGPQQDGTVFSISPTGTVTTLFDFDDFYVLGANPYAGLIDVNGIFYGTTSTGGPNGRGGTVFSITPAGVQKTIYTFGAAGDSAIPAATLLNVKGTLYGTSYGGGADVYEGTVFSVTPTGVEKVLYSFTGGSDGGFPRSNLIDVKGVLYGTASFGGGGGCNNGIGCGTVFKITPAGKFSVVYAFKGGSDGASPQAGLTNVGGTLYGTTTYGGGTDCTGSQGVGCGTVFKIVP